MAKYNGICTEKYVSKENNPIKHHPVCPFCREEYDTNLHCIFYEDVVPSEKFRKQYGRYYLVLSELIHEHWNILLKSAKTAIGSSNPRVNTSMCTGPTGGLSGTVV